MSIAPPSVPAVTQAIVDAVLARQPQGQVWDGPAPTPEALAMYVGWTPNGPAVTGTQVRGTIGQDGRRNEDYELVVHCSGISADDTPAGRRGLREDTWGLFSVLAAVLSDDPELGGAVLLAELVSYEEVEEYLDPDDNVYQTGLSGRCCAIDARIRIQNQLI